MNFLSMKYFAAVAKEKNFTHAARALHITQQTLSTHIASIEKELGCPLLLRTTPLQLTYQGEVFLRYARQFEKLYLSLNQEFADLRAETKGLLRVGIAHTRGRALLPEIIEAYHKKYPLIELQLIEGTNEFLRHSLLDGDADLLIAHFPVEMPGVRLQPFYEEELVLLIANRLLDEIYGEKALGLLQQIHRPQDLSLLADCPFLLGNQEDVGGRLGNQMIAEALVSPQITAQSTNIETLLELCLRGTGACFCPDVLVRRLLSPVQLQSVQMLRFEERVRYRISFGWLERPYCWSAISHFSALALSLMHRK
ncbi:MAG: LysR family transcriptional regulator [Oscillospiraceae bacterium]|nr:MAG: LysR family transcriptional regulator [Oscillospiraceae bacterium]